MSIAKNVLITLKKNSLVPRPLHSFCRLQYEKRGEPGNEAIKKVEAAEGPGPVDWSAVL